MAAGIAAPAPGARIIVRDAQWLVRKVERTRNGGHVIHCTGLSEIVRDREARFLTSIEKKIEVMDPAQTKLVQDTSPQYLNTRLHIESLLRRSVPTDGRIYCGHKAAMDSVDYQLDPASQALSQPRPRILIADAVGLGKTMECGILLSELIRRGRGRRILVVTVKSMMTQFQKELWSRFTIPLTRLDSAGIKHVAELIPANHNPFHYFDRSIVSVDTLKQGDTYRNFIENAWWDVIVIDEAHNVAERRNGKGSLRARLAQTLSHRSDALILLSATPHDGSARSFASLMNMLDPTAISNPEHYGPDDIRGLFIRRFKKDIKAQVTEEFKERKIYTIKAKASPAEEAVFDTLTACSFPVTDQGTLRGSGHLFRTVLEKSLFSSPDACLETVKASLAKMDKRADRPAPIDRKSLEDLQAALGTLRKADFSKYGKLVETLKNPDSPFHFTGKAEDDRLIIFTERIPTLDFLKDNLPADLRLKPAQVMTLKGSDTDTEQQTVVEEFGKASSPVRLLIASDVASEGINLHYQCCKMIHFDVPWSLMLFQQRNGRIDRYGQSRTPHIGYMMTESVNPDILGDERILELLVQKDKAAEENIGDPSAFLGKYDIEEEEQAVAAAMENGSAESLEAEMDGRASADMDDILAFLEGHSGGDVTAAADERPVPQKAAMPTLFPDDFTYAVSAVRSLPGLQDDVEIRESEKSLTFPLNAGHPWCHELRYRFSRAPREIRPRNGVITICAHKPTIDKDIAESRREEHSWPRLQYLWELNPVLLWLSDKIAASLRRLEAPVIALPGLQKGEALFILSGVIPNRKGQSVVDSWFACRLLNGVPQGEMTLTEAIAYARLDRALTNRGLSVDTASLEAMLPAVMERARRHMSKELETIDAMMTPKLNEQLSRLASRREAKMLVLDERFQSDTAIVRYRKESEKRSAESDFQEYKDWAEETYRTEDNPYICVAAVITAEGE